MRSLSRWEEHPFICKIKAFWQYLKTSSIKTIREAGPRLLLVIALWFITCLAGFTFLAFSGKLPDAIAGFFTLGLVTSMVFFTN
jgi:hypothetical protein